LNFADDYLDAEYLESTAIQHRQTPSEVKREWDRLTEVDSAHGGLSSANGNRRKSKLDEGPYNIVIFGLSCLCVFIILLTEDF